MYVASGAVNVLVGLVYRLAHGADAIFVQLQSELAAARALASQLVTSETNRHTWWRPLWFNGILIGYLTNGVLIFSLDFIRKFLNIGSIRRIVRAVNNYVS